MAFEKMSTILREVDRKGTAALAFDCMHYESIAWMVGAAEQLNLPVIIMLYPAMTNFISLEAFAAITKAVAAKAKVPVALHLDHCESFDTILGAIKAGFNSVMIDGSKLPFEQNVAVTKEIVKVAHALDVDVEAELGKVGRAVNKEDFQDKSGYTSVDEALRFTEQTNVDALAVAIGSAHGFYVEEPKLDLQRLSELNAAIDTPLVLHGGTGIPDEQLQQAFRMGINKLNLGTEYFALFYSSLREYVERGEERPGMFPMWNYQKEKVYEYALRKLALTNV
ncbi:MAG: class II fructose-bisphosphate aldolase [Eubacteriales bacterium]|nr:class II fructose-bisphosphate aldolase [Eubacteriales bacterium]